MKNNTTAARLKTFLLSIPGRTFLSAVLVGAPLFAYAAIGDIVGLLGQVRDIISLIIPFLIGLALLFFIYGLLGYIRYADNEEKRAEARQFILWGIVGLFVMLSVWGLVNIFYNSFGFSDNTGTIVKKVYSTTEKVPTTAPANITDFIDRVTVIGTIAVIPFLFTIAFFIVLFGIVNYIRQGDNEEKRAEARRFIIWGIISIFLMLSIWGLVNVLVGSFGFNNQVPSLDNIFSNLHV